MSSHMAKKLLTHGIISCNLFTIAIRRRILTCVVNGKFISKIIITAKAGVLVV